MEVTLKAALLCADILTSAKRHNYADWGLPVAASQHNARQEQSPALCVTRASISSAAGLVESRPGSALTLPSATSCNHPSASSSFGVMCQSL